MYAAYCRILGVEPGASQEEIKHAFRIKAKQFHPDINPLPSANQDFIKIKKAFDYLTGNPYARASSVNRNYSYSYSRKKYYQRPESYDWEAYRKWQNEFRQNMHHSNSDVNFRKTIFGRIVFYFFHLIFFLIGLYILIAPTWSIISEGIDPERDIATAIFAAVFASLFGLLMIVMIFISGFSINVFRKG
ncbi:MAG: DnaJ domain-containing protein [Bacteroidales bacterium]|nr:DnaJ domain-containing protein [Bacteroidales bacterium]